jgi:putative restriction endonuclease
MAKRLWTRDELILTLSVYFQLPFGRLNHATPEVKELARLIGRTENSAALGHTVPGTL